MAHWDDTLRRTGTVPVPVTVVVSTLSTFLCQRIQIANPTGRQGSAPVIMLTIEDVT